MPDEWLTASEAARLLGVSSATVTRWLRLGLLVGMHLPSGHWRVPRREVERLRRQVEDGQR